MKIGRIVVLVEDYDQAIKFYSEVLGFKVIVDYVDQSQRFVHCSLPGDDVGIWFIKSEGPAKDHVGKQCLTEPLIVFYTKDFEKIYTKLLNNDVKIKAPPVYSPEGPYMHFYDLYGNELILVGLKS